MINLTIRAELIEAFSEAVPKLSDRRLALLGCSNPRVSTSRRSRASERSSRLCPRSPRKLR
jgi:hypothetical protein